MNGFGACGGKKVRAGLAAVVMAVTFGVGAPLAISGLGLGSAFGAGSVKSCTGGYNTAESCSTPNSSAGALSGAVTGAGGATLAGICVNVYPGGGNFVYSNDAVTAADGTWTIGDLPAGTFDVKFSTGCGNTADLAPVWSGNAATEAASAPVTVTVGQTTSGIDAVMTTGGGAISGTLTDTGAATVAGVCVDAFFSGGSPYAPVATATTGSNGTYSLTGLPTGSYAVEFDPSCASTTATPYATGFYDSGAASGVTASQSSATPVSVTAGGSTATGIGGQLADGPQSSYGTAAISGTVSGLSGATSVCVDVFIAGTTDQVGGTFSPITVSGGSGTYSVTFLGQGTYDVRFDPTCQGGIQTSAYSLQWYSSGSSAGAATEAASSPVDVTSSTAAVTGIDTTMSTASGTLSGSVSDGSGAAGGVCVTAFVHGTTDQFASTSTSSGISNLGAYSMPVPDGTYDVEFTNSCGDPNNDAFQWYSGSTTQAGATPVSITTGGKATADATLTAGSSITGSVSVPSAVSTGGFVSVYPIGSSTQVAGGWITGSSSPLAYTVQGLVPGSYDVQFFASGPGGAASEWYGGPSALASLTQSGATSVGLIAGGTASGIDATFGAISGTVTEPAGDTDPIGVLLFPAGSTPYSSSSAQSLGGTVTAAGGGSYEIGLAPEGSLEVFFNDNGGEGLATQFYNGAATPSAATAVTIDSTTAKTGIDAAMQPYTAPTGGTITGDVTGAGGSQAYEICVDAYPAGGTPSSTNYSESYPNGTSTDYSLGGLAAGSYDVRFDPTCNGQYAPGYPTQYYDVNAPNDTTTNIADATAVSVTSTGTTPGVNDRLPTAATAPGAPTALAASLGNGTATLSWQAPASDGGSAITSYSLSVTDVTTSATLTPVVLSGTPPPTSDTLSGLTPGDTYAFTVTATNTVGTGPASGTLTEVLPAPYHPLPPHRICDTRPAAVSGATDQCTGKTLGNGGTLTVQVTGQGGVPTGATAVVANVTVTNPTAQSYLTAYPAGSARPLASNLNFSAGETVPNLVTVPLSATGAIDLYNAQGTVDVLVDVTGYYGPGTGAGFTPLPPARICDTRPIAQSGAAADQCTGKTPGAGANPETLKIQVTGYGRVPSGASAVVANITVTNPDAPSYLTAWSDGTTKPLASNLNFTANQTVPNRVVIPLSATGAMDLYNAQGSVDVIVDVTGYYSSASPGLYEALPPARICDTRPTVVSGLADACTGKTLGNGGTLTVPVTGQGGVPTGASGIVANVTVTNTDAQSYLTVYPGGTAKPLASDLNWSPGLTVPNLVVAELGGTGQLGVFNAAGSVDVIVDVAGWFT